MTFVQWGAFPDLGRLDRGLNAVLNAATRAAESDSSGGSWRPVVETFEKGTDLVIRAELPGISRDEIEIDVEDGTLTLCGERKRDVDPGEGTSFRSERTYGAFKRSFSLPRTVDAARISASHKDGVLEIVLPKLEQAKPKRVEIAPA